MSWRRYFRDYEVPARIQDLVDRELLEDASRPDDPAPSFIAKLYNRGWLRIWVEHPELQLRRAGPYRYRVEIAKDLDDMGRLLIEDNVLQEVWPTIYANLKALGAKSRWRLMGASLGAAKHVDEYKFGNITTRVVHTGQVGHWNYYRVQVLAPRASRFVTAVVSPSDPKQAAMSVIRSLHNAFLDPAGWISGLAKHGWGTRETALETVRLAEEIGEEDLVPAYRQATEEWFGYTEEEKRRGPLEWFPREP
jgi:hypothetical protein